MRVPTGPGNNGKDTGGRSVVRAGPLGAGGGAGPAMQLLRQLLGEGGVHLKMDWFDPHTGNGAVSGVHQFVFCSAPTVLAGSAPTRATAR